VIQIKPASDSSNDLAANRVVLGPDELLYAKTLRARELNWISMEGLAEPMRVSVKIRHRHEPATAWIENTGGDEVYCDLRSASAGDYTGTGSGLL